jgi:hypothetical protein
VEGEFAAWLAANAARWDAPPMPRPGSAWLVVEMRQKPRRWGQSETVALRFHGFRTLSSVKEEGFGVRARVSVGGKSRSVIDYHVLFQLPDGKLLSVPMMVLVGA